MRLLVSVAAAAEVAAALEGGADLIDAKDPRRGPLGPVSIDALRRIHAACARARPVSAALGDATSEAAIEDDARTFCAAGAAFVKIGFADHACVKRVELLLAAAVRGARAARNPEPTADAPLLVPAAGDEDPSATDRRRIGGVIAVAYADADRTTTIGFADLIQVAARAGAAGVLLDTADKRGPGLRALVAPDALAAWISRAHGEGLLVAIAGRLTADDLPFVRDAGADIAGVRGAACDDGRTGRVASAKVRALRALCESDGRDRHDPPEGGHYGSRSPEGRVA
jgi:uncharacterized protein (UPF0264 family)